ncbi:PGF-CTERM sorting domain-containing protein [Halogeometricum borinquense]|uniref:PGF-CTERM sorting domain-containing protein n=1 Tax=Halogeometricum borinquense TaxID=60847 RepID=A0A6C0UJ32_9EURY|nr:BGTF surface domain-containing protein [Halogeometricum borinquense]QIB75526.1 PGF-CTERM sorting domain-containing protein [Halogeometricum borinquense]
MTSNTKQFRAVFLAALMVMSVFAGTIAFAGSAAAVSGASKVTFSPTDVDEGETGSQHNVNVSISGYTNADGSADTINVTLPAGVTFASSNLVIENASGTQIGTGSVTLTNNDASAEISINPASGDVTDPIYLSGTVTVDAPSNIGSDQQGQVTLSMTQSDGSDLAATDIQQLTVNNVEEDNTAPSFEDADLYDNDTSASEDAELELAFDEPIKAIEKSDFNLYVDEEPIADSKISVDQDGTSGRVVLGLDDVYTGDVEIKLFDSIEDTSGNALDDTGNKTVTVAPVPVKDGSDINAYQGSNIAVITDNTQTEITVEASDDEDFDSFQEGNTGTNSQVYVFSTTDDTETGQYNITLKGEGSAQVNVRNLGLEVNIDDLNITTEDEIEGVVEAKAGNRPVRLELLDSDGDTVEQRDVELSGQRKYEFTFNASELDLDEDNYTVLATDKQSGVEAESSSVVVEEAGEGNTEFPGERLVRDQRGDVANITINVENSDYVTLSIGNDDLAFESNVTIEDVNGDGQVSLLFNTYAATGKSGDLGDDGGDVYNTPSIEDEDDDEIISATIEQGVGSLLEPGRYPLEARSGKQKTADAESRGTLELSERNTTYIQSWVAPTGTTYEDIDELHDAVDNANLTKTNKIANGDIAVHKLKASGLEGLLMAQSEDDVSNKFFSEVDGNGAFELTVEQANPGANRDPYELELGTDNTTVWADADNDTYFIKYDTDKVKTTERSIDDGHTLEANFTVYEDEGNLTDADDGETVKGDYEIVEAEHTLNDPYNVSNAAGQTIMGETTVAPGTELSVRASSTGDTQPSFLHTGNVYVTENQTFAATFDFSEQEIGDTYEIIVENGAADSQSVDGYIVESPETPTPTTDTPSDNESTDTPTTDTPTTDTPTTDTPTDDGDTPTGTEGTETESPTQTPGFGVVVAVTALLAAALLAVRRD